jgi:hypothetical protein
MWYVSVCTTSLFEVKTLFLLQINKNSEVYKNL